MENVVKYSARAVDGCHLRAKNPELVCSAYQILIMHDQAFYQRCLNTILSLSAE